jgi:hypothetical protein
MFRTHVYIRDQPNTIVDMDRFSFQEAVLAEYIQVVNSYTREELLSELLDVKYNQLEQLPDDELIDQFNVQRRKQKP